MITAILLIGLGVGVICAVVLEFKKEKMSSYSEYLKSKKENV